MTLYKWDRTANNDATADSTINWSEGQAPSSINDSARAMMAATAKYRDDIAGAIVTTGTSAAYLVSSYQAFDTLAHLSGQMIAFTPHVTNAGTCTLNVDSLTAKPLRTAPNAELPAGTLIQGTPYEAIYNNADGAFYLKGFYGNAYNIPIGGSIDYWLPTAPNSSFVFPFGQAISRATYATLFAGMGTTYGAGDGSTTFNLPDLRGRVVASPDNMGGSDAGRLVGNTVLNPGRLFLAASGGEAAHTQTTAEMASHNHSTTVTDPGHTHATNLSGPVYQQVGGVVIGGSANTALSPTGLTITSATTGISVSVNSNGSATAFNVLQPTILGNRIMRVI